MLLNIQSQHNLAQMKTLKSTVLSILILLFTIPAFAQKWETFHFTTTHNNIYLASSELNKPDDFTFGKYGAHNLFDQNPSTAWVEGENGNGKGAYVCLALDRKSNKHLAIYNGFQKKKSLFLQNNRVKTLILTLYIGFTNQTKETQLGFIAEAAAFPIKQTIRLADREGYQVFNFPFDSTQLEKFRKKKTEEYINHFRKELLIDKSYSTLKDFFFVKFEIQEVYRGSKWDDTCISDLFFSDKPTPSTRISEPVASVEEDDNQLSVTVKTQSGKRYKLFTVAQEDADEGTVVSVLSVSPDKKWAILDIASGGVGRSTGELFKLYYIPQLKELPLALSDSYNLGDPYDFELRNGTLYALFYNGEKACDEILEDMAMLSYPDFFRNDATIALSLLFADAINRHDSEAMIACMNRDYLNEQLVGLMKSDTLNFISDQFCGSSEKKHVFRCIEPDKAHVVATPVIIPNNDGCGELRLRISDGEKTVTCTWTIIESTNRQGLPQIGLAGSVG